MSGHGKEKHPEGSGDLFLETSQKISEGLSRASLGGEAGPEEITAVVEGAVSGILAVQGDLVVGAKGILLGVLQATGETGEDALRTVGRVARTVVTQTAKSEEDLAAVTKGLVLGAIAGAKSINVELATAASTAAQGALEGAAGTRESTVDSIREALKKSIGGIMVSLPPKR